MTHHVILLPEAEEDASEVAALAHERRKPGFWLTRNR